MQSTSGRSALLAWRRCATALRGVRTSRCAPLLRVAHAQRQQALRAFSGTSSACTRTAAATSTEPKPIDAFPTAAPAADATNGSEGSSLALLEKSIAVRDPVQALLHFDELQVPPSPMIAQRLAILLAKKGTEVAQVARAKQVLKDVYMYVLMFVLRDLLGTASEG